MAHEGGSNRKAPRTVPFSLTNWSCSRPAASVPGGYSLPRGARSSDPSNCWGFSGSWGILGARPLLGILTVNPATEGRDRPIIG